VVLRLAGVQQRAADQLLFEQALVPLEFGFRQGQVGLGRSQGGLGGLPLQGDVGSVQLGQELAGLHPVADLGQAPGQLAADAEGQHRLVPGPDLAGEAGQLALAGTGLDDQGRPGRGGLVTIAGAGCQGQQARQDKSTENQGFDAHRGRSQLLNCRYANFTQPESSIIMSAMSRPARNPTPPGRPKDLEKRAAILDAAKTLFPERGYEGTSMDAIAQAAGVSKLTVYSHFQDKDTLFVEAVKAKCEELLPQDLFVKHSDEAWERQLERVVQAFFRLINSEEAIAVARVLARQMSEDSHLPRLFWEAGPKRTQETL